MNEQFLNKVENGFLMWADNFFCNRAQGYITVTTPLYYLEDDRLDSSKVAYASPFKSWVHDSGVDGAYIPRAISGSLGTINVGQSGMLIDYVNGRVLLDSGVGTRAQLTGTYSFKELNFYPTNDTIEAIIIENKYTLNSRFDRPESGIQPYDFVTPAIFINVSESTNKPWAFGGLKNSTPTITLAVLAETSAQVSAAISVFADASEKYFPLLPYSSYPLNESGDFKNATGYSYSVAIQNASLSDYVFIQSVRGSKLSDRIPANENLFLGLIDLQLSNARTT